MQILKFNESGGYTFLGEDHNYYAVIDNTDCNAIDEVYPMQLGPFMAYERCIELPF